jgi:hypothetical protein
MRLHRCAVPPVTLATPTDEVLQCPTMRDILGPPRHTSIEDNIGKVWEGRWGCSPACNMCSHDDAVGCCWCWALQYLLPTGAQRNTRNMALDQSSSVTLHSDAQAVTSCSCVSSLPLLVETAGSSALVAVTCKQPIWLLAVFVTCTFTSALISCHVEHVWS